MPLDSLLSLVERLRERIDVHGDKLRQNEALTRYALIDPLLRELGWDTEDPALVIPEYKTDDGWPDYALLSEGKPVMMVEAKKLGTSLQGKVISQGIGYCLEQGTPYFSVTDGRLWKIYETHRPVPIDEKRIAEFDLKNGSAAEVCLKALTLWEIRVSGRVATGQIPVAGPPPNRSAQPESPIPNPQPMSPPDKPEPEWQPISELNPPKDSKPSEVQFPDNKLVRFTPPLWKSLLVEITRWLVDNRYLTTNDCPLGRTPRSKRYVVSTTPRHPSGKDFENGEEVGAIHLETHGPREELVKAARFLIKHVGQDPARFKVRFS